MKLLPHNIHMYITLPLLIALGFSAFIYCEYFAITSKLFNTLLALSALYGLLHAPRITLPIAGFWIGLLWFYWIGYSFQYYDMAWAIGPVAIGFGLVYALYFGSLGLTSNPWIRGMLLFALTFLYPVDFNWMQPELIFIESYIGFEKWQFAFTLALLASCVWFRQWKKLLPLLLLPIVVETSYPKPTPPPLQIKLVSSEVPQDLKWQMSQQEVLIQNNLDAIVDAIDKKYDLVVLPEAAFPLYMNQNPQLIETLQQLSGHIVILTGTLLEEKGRHYNVSYLFDNDKITIAKKMILVPFGEYVPLPSFIRTWVNREIFGGGLDFVTADKPTDFVIKGIRFRNAICYEATRKELYTPDAAYFLAISNNGWFKPSIEPTLQNLLIRFYARKNHSMVFHSANSQGTSVVY
jgi:apolipoprotein N-acyltransferase